MISYTKYTPLLKRGVVELLDLHWGWSDLERSSRFFEWRYENNPYTEVPCVFVAKDGPRVVGLRCYVIQEFGRVSGSFLVATPADAIVHPEYRRRGLFSDLTRYSLDQRIGPGVRVVLSLSANRASAAANRKAGWTEFGIAKFLYRIGFKGEDFSVARSRPNTGRIGKVAVSVSEITAVETPPDCRYPEIAPTQLANARDEAYYAWRYSEPFAKYYYAHAQDGDQKGYLILKQTGRRRFNIMQYGFDAAPVLAAIISAFVTSTGTALLRMLDLTLSSSEVAELRAAGFFYEPSWLVRLLNKHRGSALVHLVNAEQPLASGKLRHSDIAGVRNWHIVSADIH